jgi:hypothetical protein
MSVVSFPSRAYASEEAARLYAKLPSLQWGEFSRLIGLGVPVWPELPACATVVFDRKRPQFDFAEEVGDQGAISAFLFLARDEDGEPADLVAWAPSVNRLAAWFGAVALLGAEDLWAPRLTKERALPVFEAPLGWLRAGREGVVVISRSPLSRSRSSTARSCDACSRCSRRAFSLQTPTCGARHDRAHSP